MGATPTLAIVLGCDTHSPVCVAKACNLKQGIHKLKNQIFVWLKQSRDEECIILLADHAPDGHIPQKYTTTLFLSQ